MEHTQNTLPQLPELKKFEINKTPILACMAITREIVALRPVVENLQLKWNNELNKLKSYYTPDQLLYAKSLSSDGKYRTMVCLSIGDFNDWLWRLNPQGENADLDLLHQYRQNLVLQLMMMLRISLNEVERLQVQSQKLIDLQMYINKYTELLERANELRNESNYLTREAKEIKAKMKEISEGDPGQLGFNFKIEN